MPYTINDKLIFLVLDFLYNNNHEVQLQVKNTLVSFLFLSGNSAVHKTKTERVHWEQSHRKDNLIESCGHLIAKFLLRRKVNVPQKFAQVRIARYRSKL